MGTDKTDLTGMEVPEHCLVRGIDVTVESGKAYEYRLAIRMANPNYGRKDVLSTTYAQDSEITSEWSKVPIKVRFDADLNYYAVDQAEVTGPGTTPPVMNARMPVNKNKQVVLQAHRWIDKVPNGTRTPTEVGEWVLADRFAVYRGEYVGRKERVEVPFWSYTHREFTLMHDPKAKGKVSGIEVDFGFGRNDRNPPEALVVDFEHGRPSSYSKVARRTEDKVETRDVKDQCAVEVVLLSPDGKLLGHNAAEDTEDKDRKERRERIIERVKDVKEHKKKDAEPKKPFGS